MGGCAKVVARVAGYVEIGAGEAGCVGMGLCWLGELRLCAEVVAFTAAAAAASVSGTTFLLIVPQIFPLSVHIIGNSSPQLQHTCRGLSVHTTKNERPWNFLKFISARLQTLENRPCHPQAHWNLVQV